MISQSNRFYLLILLIFSCSHSFANEDQGGDSGLSLGVGIGIPYGILGVNAEYRPIDLIGITGCVGTAIIIGGMAKCVGASIYMPNAKKSLAPRLSVIYGSNGLLIADKDGDLEVSVHDGLSIGGGIVAGTAHHRVTLDLMIIISSEVFDEEDKLEAQGYEISGGALPAFMNRVKTSVGYRYVF